MNDKIVNVPNFERGNKMHTFTIVLLIITGILLIATISLYFIGKKADKKKGEQDKLLEQSAQTVSLLIIDKKKMKLKDAGLPAAVLEKTPWYLRGTKAPIVKVKIGPNIMTLLCAPEIFDDVPIKKEVKAVISGLYLTAIKGTFGKRDSAPKKLTFMQKLRKKAGM